MGAWAVSPKFAYILRTMYYTDFSSIPRSAYSIVYADPPWTYRDKAADGKRGACFKYPVMTAEEICLLPVREIAAPDSVLFLWTTFPHIDVALKVIDAWKFTYKTVAFTWAKRSRSGISWHFGMGNWTRANAEVCLLGVRGKIRRVSASVSSLVESPVLAHSRKPVIVREHIVRLMGQLPRIELFARGADPLDPGWDQWGDTPDY